MTWCVVIGWSKGYLLYSLCLKLYLSHLRQKNIFGIVAVVVQFAFRLKIYQNYIFFYFLKIILRSAHQNDLKIYKKIIFSKKK